MQATESTKAPAVASAREPEPAAVLVLGGQPGVGADDVLRALRDAGLPEEDSKTAAKRLRGNAPSAAAQEGPAVVDPDIAAGIADLAQWLADVPSVHILALHQRPERPVAQAIANGESVEDALAEWRRTAEALLAVCRRDRRRVSLLDAHAAAAAPVECLARLGDRLKQRLPVPSISPADTTPETPVMERAIAALAVQQSEETQALLGELEASSLPVSDPIDLVVPDAAVIVQAHNEDDAAESARQQLEEENELLLMQLHQVQEELESYYLQAQEVENRHQKATEENSRLQKQVREYAEEIRKLKNRRHELKRDNAHHAEEIRKLKKRRHELKTENEHLERELARTRKNVADIKKSLSWKVTTPLRAVRGGPRIRPTVSAQRG